MAQQTDSSDSGSELLPIEINRRNLLLTTSVGIVSGGSFSTIVAAQTNGDIIWESGFESFSSGDVPSNFVLAGNNDQQVTTEVAHSGSHSYEMNGSYGGCWEAIMRRELFNNSSRPDAMRIKGTFRLGNGNVGCHNNRRGDISWRTLADSSWGAGSGASLLVFKPNGEVKSNGEKVGEYNRNEWINFTVDYQWNRDDGTVTHTCSVGDAESVTVTRDARDNEGAQTALELKSGDFTVYWDDLSVEKIGSNFDISISSTNSPVEAGKALTVEVEVENTGNAQGTKSVALETPSGTQVDSSSVTLSADETTTITLTWNTDSGDATQGDITVTSNNTQTTESVTIEQQGSANVTVSLSVPSEVNPETAVDVSGTVENTGEAAAEGGTTLTIDEETVDSVDTISAGETLTLSGSFEAGTADETYDVTITGPNNTSESTTVTVTEPATSELGISLDVPNSVEPNTTFDVSGTVENMGDAEASGGATLSVDGDSIDSADGIAANESVTLSGSVEAGEAGSSHTILIESPDGGSESQTVTVEAAEQAGCTGSPTMSRTSITSPQETITDGSPARVEANFRVDPNVPQDCSVIVNLEYSFSQSGFQFSGGSGWDQSASDIVATQFDGLDSGEIRSISADVEANGADPGDEVTVVADYEVWYEGNRAESLQQTTRETIKVEGSTSGGDGTSGGGDGTSGGGEDDGSVAVEVPGFGIPSTLTALGSAGYMIKRRLTEDKD